MHLALEVARRTGAMRLNHEAPWTMNPEETCALDVADRGEHGQAEVARLLGGVTIEWVRRTEVAGRAQMRVRGGPGLQAILGLHVPDPRRSDGPSTLADVALDEMPPRAPADVEALEEAETEAWADQVVALVRAGLSLRVASAIAYAKQNATEEEDEMASKKGKGKKAKANGHQRTLTGHEREGGVERAEFVEKLPCRLDEAELLEVKATLSKVTVDRVDKEAEKTLLAADIKGLKEREKALVKQVHEVAEEREVDCVEILYAETNAVDTIRRDTGEVVRTRTATLDDLQETLPDHGDGGDEPAGLDDEG